MSEMIAEMILTHGEAIGAILVIGSFLSCYPMILQFVRISLGM